eukprot:TRINITY_DN23709_c0_g1_i2.p1 TRINITY_DN23709_c0_g1~~TRINITY_DN23709_c0_g1_i2.p1  ORF type:complete len:465 (+),score=25.78 TRINITY_DN23709_c0_g1_i2:46-1395(+)
MDSIEDDETRPLLDPHNSVIENRQERPPFIVAIATLTVYVTAIFPVTLVAPLAPALEADASVDWSVKETTRLTAMTPVFEGIGMIALGWLPDVFGGVPTLAAVLVACGFCQFMMSSVFLSTYIFLMHALQMLFRGVSYGAALSMIGSLFSEGNRALGICVLAVASRCGDTMTAELFGLIEIQYDWRVCLKVISCFEFAGALILMCLPNRQSFRARTDEASQGVQETQFASFVDVIAYLKKDTNYHLMLTMILLQQPLGTFGLYMPTFAHSLYGVSVAQSAFIYRVFPCSQALGMISLTGIVCCTGENQRRICAVVAILFSAGSSVFVVAFSLAKLPVEAYAMTGGMIGASTALLDYLPPAFYLLYLGRKTGSTSRLTTITYGPMCFIAAFWSWNIGQLRSSYGVRIAYQVAMITASVSLFLGPICLAALSRNTWDTALACSDCGEKSAG